MARTWMISADSGPAMSMPNSLSVAGSTKIFMNARLSLPEMVFFIGLHTKKSPVRNGVGHRKSG